ncbi:hypothetical protein AAY473_020199 [Plecturocebus cupreus]
MTSSWSSGPRAPWNSEQRRSRLHSLRGKARDRTPPPPPPDAASARGPREVQVGDAVRGAPGVRLSSAPADPRINPTFSVSPHPAPREAAPQTPSPPGLTCAGEGAKPRAQRAAPAGTASSQRTGSLAPAAAGARRAASPRVLFVAAPAPAAARAGDLTTFLSRRLQLPPFPGSRTVPCAPPSAPSPPGSRARGRPERRSRERGRRGGEPAPGLQRAGPGPRGDGAAPTRGWNRLSAWTRSSGAETPPSQTPAALETGREPGTPRGAQPFPTSRLAAAPGRWSALLFLSKLRVTFADARGARAFGNQKSHPVDSEPPSRRTERKKSSVHDHVNQGMYTCLYKPTCTCIYRCAGEKTRTGENTPETNHGRKVPFACSGEKAAVITSQPGQGLQSDLRQSDWALCWSGNLAVDKKSRIKNKEKTWKSHWYLGSSELPPVSTVTFSEK